LLGGQLALLVSAVWSLYHLCLYINSLSLRAFEPKPNKTLGHLSGQMSEIVVCSLNLAAAICALRQMKLLRAERTSKGRCAFIFEGTREQFSEILDQFDSDLILVPARTFASWRGELSKIVRTVAKPGSYAKKQDFKNL
jgi:hypothetical protein